MRKKRLTRKQRMIRAYIARAVAVVIVIIMLVLMFCGCLYIRDLFAKGKDGGNDKKVETSKDKDSNDKDSQEVSENDAQADVPDNDNTEDTENTENTVPSTSDKYAAFSIVLDAGHGGYDGGTSSGDVIEKNVNLPLTLEVASLLESQGVKVTLTRGIDDFVSLEKRVSIANQTTANYFVSLHCNFFEGDNTVDGFEVFYVKDSEGGQKLAENIATEASTNPNIVVRGATANAYYVTRNTSMDAVLIEMGFLSNPTECQKLASADYQKQLATAIANGIFKQFDADMAGN